ncbi:mitochondrial inner membrane protein Mitofilin [Dipodascopsis tothii]|uniref:mitochondrial inner membrane protein Mitofilin n=1 Tax=Dipodascopsis tothii TaxID=44089 RepID=UPI0034CE4E1A
MLRISGQRAIKAYGARGAAGSRMLVHTTAVRANNKIQPTDAFPASIPLTEGTAKAEPQAEAKGPEEEPQAGPKPRRWFRKLVYTTAFLAASFYAGGTYFSLQNDNFHDFFTEYVPLGENIVHLIEEYEFQRRFPDAGSRVSVHESSLPGDNKVTVKRGGATWRIVSDEYKGPSSGPHVSAIKSAESAVAAVKEALPAAAAADGKLPILSFDGVIDPALEGIVHGVNGVFKSINESGAAVPASLEELATSLTEMSSRFVAVKGKFEDELKSSLDSQASMFAQLMNQRTEEVRGEFAAQEDKWNEQFFAERQKIVDVYNAKVAAEVRKLEQLFAAQLQNALIAANTQKDEAFKAEIAQRVETERAGRLSKLEDLSKSFEKVVSLSEKVDALLDGSEKAAALQTALFQLNAALKASHAVPLGAYIRQLTAAVPDDALVKVAVDALPPAVYDAGVLSPAQLSNRFTQVVAPEIRRVALVPDEAGVAAHIGSALFSKLFWKKSGKPLGEDVESVLARTEAFLLEGNVVDAVREVNSLTGWRKKVAEDWLVEGRKRSEVEFLVQVLSEEGKFLAAQV